MKKEDIKELKKGDVITIAFRVTDNNDRILSLGKVDGRGTRLKMSQSEDLLRGDFATKGYRPACAIFKKGDTVRVVPDPMTGTIHSSCNRCTEFKEGDEATVDSEPGCAGLVKISRNIRGFSELNGIYVSVHCLELVRKNEQFSVKEDGGSYVITSAAEGMVAEFIKTTHPNALAAAKAECDRLNEEWRAQQEGGEA